MRPRKMVDKTSRKKPLDTTAEEILSLIPIWNELGAVIGRARRTGEGPVLSKTIKRAIEGLLKVEWQGEQEADVLVAHRFYGYVDQFEEVLEKIHGKRSTPEKVEEGKCQLEPLISEFRKFVTEIGGDWVPVFAKKLRNFGWTGGGFGRNVVKVLVEFMPDEYDWLRDRDIYDRKTKFKKSPISKSMVITPDFSWYFDVLNALEVPDEFIEKYLKGKPKSKT